MIGERIVDVLSIPGESKEEWPDFQIVTDRGCYRYEGRSFVRDRRAPAGVAAAREAEGRVVSGIFGDGESAVVVFVDGTALVFDLLHNPWESSSWPEVRFIADHLLVWSAELESLRVVDPDSR